MFTFFDPIIPLLRDLPRELNRNAHTDLLTKVLTVPLFLLAESHRGGTEQKQRTGFKNHGILTR